MKFKKRTLKLKRHESVRKKSLLICTTTNPLNFVQKPLINITHIMQLCNEFFRWTVDLENLVIPPP